MVDLENSIVSAIMLAQEKGEPERVYRKAIVGKVAAKVIDPFSGSRAEVLIEGAPGRVDASQLEISLWTPFEVKYFEQFNKGLIEAGSLILVETRSEMQVDHKNALSDEELEKLAKAPYLSMEKTLKEITSETTVQRLLKVAKELSRPSKTVQRIELRLEELQQNS